MTSQDASLQDTADAPACRVCGALSSAPAISHQGMELLRCTACGFVFLHPMPSEAEVAELYDDYDGATTSYFAKPDKKMRRARHRIRQIRRYARRGAFLDVGCNGGFVVEAAREAGFDAHGIDPDPQSIAYADGHYPDNTYYTGVMEGFDPGPLRFDAVYCSEVIEHVPDVNAFVAAIMRIMAPGAILYLTTPDISHWRRPRDLTQWDAFCPPFHCLFFSPGNLRRLLARHGLEVIRRRPTFKPGIKVFARRCGA